MYLTIIIFSFLLLLLICFLIFLFFNRLNSFKINTLNEVKKYEDRIAKEANEKAYEIIRANNNELEEKKQNLFELEKNILKKENEINIKNINIFEREKILKQLKTKLDNDLEFVENKKRELKEKEEKIISDLQEMSKLSIEEARQKIMSIVEKDMELKIISYKRDRLEKANEDVETISKNIIASAISRYARDEVTNLVTTNISLSDDEIKGKLIGKEGRNIKVLEQTLKVDLIIDDTPKTVIVSSFCPLRREIAKITIEQLINDGRIQPSSIEEYAKKAADEINRKIYKDGQEALVMLNISGVPKQIIELVGSLKFRLSFGQNVYDHSIEVANLAGMMAAELGLDQTIAKRAGLLHDIGKSADHEYEGSHVDLGVKIAKEFGENEIVINSIASHHGDVEPTSVIAVLVQAADALSAGRPGARDKINETFFKRMEQLESICREFNFVEKAYVLRSGREIRVIVNAQKATDDYCFKLAKNIKEKIESQVIYPGEIKITVIRESRIVEKAK